MLEKEIREVFSGYPDIIYGFADLSYCSYRESYRSVLVIAVPYGEQLSPDDYTEERFDQGIHTARDRLETALAEIERVLQKRQVKYWIPPVAQENETELRALFSFKTAAAQAGIGTGSCGPIPAPEYLLDRKEIHCCFEIKPIRGTEQ